ncbi:MAG: hypothetical protein E7652_00235 [Ruminococcaceae bacterium]|nr:hypothetical protein [Oscillospiraceae bacterium]
MVKITKHADLVNVKDENILPYIKCLLGRIQASYNYRPDQSIEPIGAVFLLETDIDLLNYAEFGLSVPLTENRFEWIETVEQGNYCDGCIVIDNERAINIVGKRDFFAMFGA